MSCLARLPAQARLLLLFQLVDQVDGIAEAHPLAQMDGGCPQGGGEMGLAGAGPADQDQIARLAQEGGGGQLLDLGLLQGRLGPVEPEQVAVDREVRGRELVAQPAGMAVGLLGRDGPVQPNLRDDRLLAGFGLPFGPGGGHAVEVQRLGSPPPNGHGAPPASYRNGHSRPRAPGAMPGREGRQGPAGGPVPPAGAWCSTPPGR
jgi:hypothetical protein